MILRRLLFGIAVLSVSVLTMTLEAKAKDQLPIQRGQRTGNKSFMVNAPRRMTSTQSKGRVHGFSMSKREFDKFIKSAVKRCGCAAPAQDSDYSSGCITTCMKNYGVNAMTLAACAGSCRVNLVGCAICLGVGEWIVLGCAQYCVWRDVLSYVEDSASNRGRPSTKRPGKSLIRAPVSAVSS